MTTDRKNWCWHLGLATLAIGGAIASSGEYAFAQNVDCNSEPPTSDIHLLYCTCQLPHTVTVVIGSQPGNPGGMYDPTKLEALPSATILRPQALP